MHSKSNNIEIMISNEADEFIKNVVDSLKNRSQSNLQSIKGSEFVFNYIQLLYYKCHRITFNRSRSNIDSSDRMNNKKTTINYINK